MIVSVSCYVGVGFVVAALCYTVLRCLTGWWEGGDREGRAFLSRRHDHIIMDAAFSHRVRK